MHTIARLSVKGMPLGLLLTLQLVGVPSAAVAQSRQEHTVMRIERSDVGPYRPEQAPNLARAADLIERQVNEFRRAQQLQATETDAKLRSAAQQFAEYMARTDEYGHTAGGTTPAERAREQGYQYCIILENIAFQFRTTGFTTEELAHKFVAGWKDSPPHRENMLDPDVTETGVGVAQSESTGVFYAVQMFGRPRSDAIEFRIANKTDQAVYYRVGDHSYPLPPRYLRTHSVCRPSPVTLLRETEEGSLEAVQTVRPLRGDRFIIVEGQSGQIQIEPDELVEPRNDN